MSADKYPSISSRQMKAIVYLGVRLDNMVYTTSFPGLFFPAEVTDHVIFKHPVKLVVINFF